MPLKKQHHVFMTTYFKTLNIYGYYTFIKTLNIYGCSNVIPKTDVKVNVRLPLLFKLYKYPCKKSSFWWTWNISTIEIDELENYLHNGQGNRQTEEKGLCCGQCYNYLVHLNTAGTNVWLAALLAVLYSGFLHVIRRKLKKELCHI